MLHLAPPAADASPVTLSDVAFASAEKGSAVGYRCGGSAEQCSGVVITTGDGGVTWSIATTLPQPLTNVKFLQSPFGWAWGPAALYTTSNSGSTWVRATLPAAPGGEPILFASFVDARDGWLARGDLNCATQGCPIWIWATTDGGAEWTQVATNLGAITPQGGLANPPPNGLPWMTWAGGGDLGGERGWLLTSLGAGTILVTSNGGASWTTAVRLQSATPAVAAAIVQGGLGWAAGAESGSSPVVTTDDGGTTWQSLGSVAGDVVAISPALDGKSGWALLGPNGEGDRVAVLTAGAVGAVQSAPGGYRIDAVDPLSATAAWAVATGPWAGYALLQTADGGAQWTLRYRTGSDVPSGPWGFWNAAQGWAVGATMDPSAVLRTNDGGKAWSVVAELPTTNVVGAGFPSPTFGWVLTGQGTILVSHDGGTSWAPGPHAEPCGDGPVAAGFDNPLVGWLGLPASTGCAAALWVTSDGGATWSQAMAGTVWSAALSPNGGAWAVVSQADGGHALEIRSGAAQPWREEAALPAALGRAPLSIDSAGGLWLGTMRSMDGGHTWTSFVAAQGTATLSAMEFVSAHLGWAESGGALYATGDGGSTWDLVMAPGAPLPPP